MNHGNANKFWLDDIELVGGHPALDFVNTVHSYATPAPRDYLQSTHHLFDWCRHTVLVHDEQVSHLHSLAGSDADALLRDARNLRASLHAVFQGHLKGRSNSHALAGLNERLKKLACYRTLEFKPDGYTWHHVITRVYPQSLFGPIVFAAAELLQSTDLPRLKSCPPPEGCGLLFLDRSRNGSRTWCNMKTCGNVAKQRRHRARLSDHDT